MENEITTTAEQFIKSEPIGAVGANSLIMNPDVMKQVGDVARMMASGSATVPKHLQKSVGDCFAIVMQAAQWGMNPFAVAQKTHIVNGTLGYEAQLVNAVISSSRAIKGRFKYEYHGDWLKPNSPDAAVRVGAVISGEKDITWGEWLFVANVITKNSPLWKTAPKQQASYLVVKYWARLFCPEVIMGVYSHDELEPSASPVVKEPNPDEALEFYADDEFDSMLPKWASYINGGKAAGDLILAVESKGKLFTDAQKEILEGVVE